MIKSKTKKFLFGAMVLLFTTFASAQASLPVGANQINLGLGMSNVGLPVYLGFDHGITNDISFGLEFSMRGYNENYKGNYYDHNVFGFSGNANYHFNRVLNIPAYFDFYAGLNLGVYFWSSPNGYFGEQKTGLGLGAQIGARYFFSNKIAVNLEVGGGNAFSGGKVGLTFRL